MTTTEEAKMTEEDFLDTQAEEASAALHETWAELKSTLKETASLDVWAKRHPWLVAGSAVAGGFLIATMLFSPSAPAEAASDEEQREAPAGRPRRLGWLVGPLFALVRPIFGQLVSSLISGAVGAMTGAMAAEAADPADDASSTSGPGEGPVPI